MMNIAWVYNPLAARSGPKGANGPSSKWKSGISGCICMDLFAPKAVRPNG